MLCLALNIANTYRPSLWRKCLITNHRKTSTKANRKKQLFILADTPIPKSISAR